MFSEYQNIRVIGMAAAVSNTWDSLLKVSDEDPAIIEKFVKKIGVSGRYSASIKQTTADFCYAAAEKVLTEKGIDRSQIGVLVFVSQTPDYRLPATGCVLQHRLGLDKNCIVFDVNLGCSGFVYGMNIVSSLLNASNSKYGLLLAGDISAREFSSKRKDKLGHSAALLFGDSGTATLIEKQEGNRMMFSSATDGNGYKAIIAPYGDYRNPESPDGRIYYTKMDDVAVFNFATNEVPDQINEYMKKLNTTPEDYDCLVLHQANLMIMKRITKKVSFPAEKMIISMDRFGNTSSSSIPLTLVDKYGEKNGETIKALCCGYGVGLSWSTVALELNTNDIYQLVHTDDYYRDGYNVDDIETINEGGKNND